MTPFGVIVADPPWPFDDSLTMSEVKRGARSNYATLSVDTLCQLPVQEVASDDGVLVLWCPATILESGFAVMRAWGFEYKQLWVWVKTTKDGKGLAFGMGRLARSCKEVALVGVRGRPYGALKDHSVRDVFPSPKRKHSQKPEDIQDALERMFPDWPRLELFARRDREGWTALGNEVPGMEGVDISDALKAVSGLIRERETE